MADLPGSGSLFLDRLSFDVFLSKHDDVYVNMQYYLRTW